MDADQPVTIGFIIRNCDGDFLLAGTDCCRAVSAEEAECKGLLLAVKTGICQGLHDVVFETDNKNAANYLAGIPASLSWSSVNILDEAKLLSLYFQSVCFIFCNRTGNCVAHTLATQRGASYLVPTLYHVPPVWLIDQLRRDNMFCNIANS
ncbi:hypothetical protein FRX31_028131 [Thalictrum thalictroides]|uniref:RNase H type-1 domain-containing protein n=1 Tax=Thalictrum thalictroides TaxID=46969 RepID=A0A7J6VD63_THATH|nr:hypothetical protein FRX31_028131 [Thalictrum thalictroides]